MRLKNYSDLPAKPNMDKFANTASQAPIPQSHYDFASCLLWARTTWIQRLGCSWVGCWMLHLLVPTTARLRLRLRFSMCAQGIWSWCLQIWVSINRKVLIRVYQQHIESPNKIPNLLKPGILQNSPGQDWNPASHWQAHEYLSFVCVCVCLLSTYMFEYTHGTFSMGVLVFFLVVTHVCWAHVVYYMFTYCLWILVPHISSSVFLEYITYLLHIGICTYSYLHIV